MEVDVKVEEPEPNKTPPMICSMRLVLSLMGFLMLAIQSMQRVNMSVAIVCMVNHTAVEQLIRNNQLLLLQNMTTTTHTPAVSNDHTNKEELAEFTVNDSCHHSLNSNSAKADGEFVWPKIVQGVILSTVYFGNMLSQIFGSWLALKYGCRNVIAFAIIFDSLLTLFSPIAARVGYMALIGVRFFIGIAHGIETAAITSIVPYWIPPSERSTILAVTSVGTQIGLIITFPVGGLLCVHGFDGGWPSIFYTTGLSGIFWAIVWLILITDTPNKNKFIAESEKRYINRSCRAETENHNKENPKIPWKHISTSKPFYALVISQCCFNFGSYVFSSQLPSYMKEVLKMDIKKNGLLSALPYCLYLILCIASGILSDKLIKNGKLSKLTCRKLFNTIGFIFPMTVVLGLILIDCSKAYLAVVLITLGLGFSGLTNGAGYFINYFDVGGIYSSMIMSIASTVGFIVAIVSPFLTSVITRNKSQEEWRILFILISAIYSLGAFSFLMLADGNTQSWAVRKNKTTEEEDGEEMKPLEQ